ncbi:MAG TPA: RDD family protein [Chitinophaga sp.]
MAYIKIPTAFNIDLEFEAADSGKRLFAYLIDNVVRIAYLVLCYWLIAATIPDGVTRTVVLFFVAGLPFALYFFLTEWLMAGQSPGKLALGIKVVSLLGNQPTVGQIMLRSLMRIIESPLVLWAVIPLVAIARSPYSQRLGDLVAGTIVVNTRAKHTIQDTIFRDMSQVDYQPQFYQILKLSDKDLNKVKELLDRATKQQDFVLASRVADRVKTVLKIETNMGDMQFLETLLNDYNYLVTRA